jgi:chitinase
LLINTVWTGSTSTGSIRSTALGLVASQPADRDNFTAAEEMRDAFGHKKLVTIAVGANAESPKSWVDVKAIAPARLHQPDDLRHGVRHAVFNANLYDSSAWPTVAAADKYSVDFVVNNYLAAGLKPQQMNLGIGFYGRVPKRAVSRALTGRNRMRKKSGHAALLRAAGDRVVQVARL